MRIRGCAALAQFLIWFSSLPGDLAEAQDPTIQAFEQWLEDLAGYRLADVGVRVGRNENGLGLFALRPFTKGDTCLEAPLAIALDVETCTRNSGPLSTTLAAFQAEDPDFSSSPERTEAEFVALRLAFEASIGQSSQWFPYVELLEPDSIPSTNSTLLTPEIWPPAFFDDKLYRRLSGTGLIESLEVRHFAHQKSLDRLVATAMGIAGVFEGLEETEVRKLMHWALWMVKSRAHKQLGLVPLMDMVNHDTSGEIAEKKGRPENPNSLSFGFQCAKDLVPGDEMLYNYLGDMSPRETVLDFGFLEAKTVLAPNSVRGGDVDLIMTQPDDDETFALTASDLGSSIRDLIKLAALEKRQLLGLAPKIPAAKKKIYDEF